MSNLNPIPAPAAPVWSFTPGQIISIGAVLYEFRSSDAALMRLKAVDTGIEHLLPQIDFDAMLAAGEVDARIEENDPARKVLRLRFPGSTQMSDLPEDEQKQLLFITRLCRRLVDLKAQKLITFGHASVRAAIPRVMAEITFGIEEPPASTRGKPSVAKQKAPKGRSDRMAARTTRVIYEVPAPTTVLGWIRKLKATGWDEMQVRDGRKGRKIGSSGRKTLCVWEIMRHWVEAYKDRNQPSQALLYRLMLGGPDLSDGQCSRTGYRPPAELPTFHAENERRAVRGLPSLVPPSLSTFRRAIGKLAKFDVALGRKGPSTARREFKVAGRHQLATRPGEMVGIDSWRIHQIGRLLPPKTFLGLPTDVRKTIEDTRLSLTLAIDAATRCILGCRLALNPSADTTLRTLRMVCVDKTDVAREAGCRSTWPQRCTPDIVPMDNGTEHTDARVRAGIRDIGAQNAFGRAGVPDERGWVESAFRTFDIQLLPLFQGRTFSNVVDKKNYPKELLEGVLIPVLQEALVRYIVDVYHNSPHAGLLGQTPVDAWIQGSRTYGVRPPPSAASLRAAFGFMTKRRIQNDGLREFGLYYANEDLARIRALVGQEEVLVRIDLDDIDTASVRADRPGAPWVTVPCRTPMKGVSVEEWLETAAELRRRHEDVSALRAPVVLAALADIRRLGLRSALDAGIGPSTITHEEIRLKTDELFRHFNIVTPMERGGVYDFSEGTVVEISDATSLSSGTAAVPDGGFGPSDEQPIATRRNRRRSSSRRENEQ